MNAYIISSRFINTAAFPFSGYRRPNNNRAVEEQDILRVFDWHWTAWMGTPKVLLLN